MPRRARIALIGAGAGTLLLALTWLLTHDVAIVRRADVAILAGFADLGRPRLDELTNRIARLCDPSSYVILAVIPIAMALLRRRPRVAVMIGAVLLAANETTQLLKPLVAAPRDYLPAAPISAASWPSGHATAAMTLALCMVIAAPARRRSAVAAGMAAFAVAVSYSFLELGWHYPSDVLGGFLVAGTWTLLGVAGLSIYEDRRAVRTPRPGGGSLQETVSPVIAILLAAGGAVALIALVRPRAVVAYVESHPAFVVGAGAIALLGVLLASGLSVVLRRT